MDLLKRYVDAHNEIVRTGKSEALAQLFDERSEMHFHGIPVGPFVGRAAIVNAIHAKPPTDELVLFEGGRYGWTRGGPGGEFRVTPADGVIARLDVIVFPAP